MVAGSLWGEMCSQEAELNCFVGLTHIHAALSYILLDFKDGRC